MGAVVRTGVEDDRAACGRCGGVLCPLLFFF